MKKTEIDYTWQTDTRWWHYDVNMQVVMHEEAPQSVKDSYAHYLDQCEEILYWDAKLQKQHRRYEKECKKIDYDADRYCPAYGGIIDSDLCYDSLMCLKGMFKISSTKELARIENIEIARKKCAACFFSKLD